MRSLIKTMLIAIGLFSASSSYAQKPAAKPATAAPISLKNKADSIQYALGAYMGRYMIVGGFESVNLNYFLPGLNDAYSNKPKLINDSICFVLISNYQSEAEKQKGKLLEQELFNALKDRPGVGKLPSGVQYSILKQGAKGPKPLETDSIKIHFKGTLPDGTVFENTFLRNTPLATTPATLIPGLKEILQLMSVGDTWQVFIPSALGYGEKGNGRIPANSALLVTVELLEIANKK